MTDKHQALAKVNLLLICRWIGLLMSNQCYHHTHNTITITHAITSLLWMPVSYAADTPTEYFADDVYFFFFSAYSLRLLGQSSPNFAHVR